jgi:hypothetical protein
LAMAYACNWGTSIVQASVFCNVGSRAATQATNAHLLIWIRRLLLWRDWMKLYARRIGCKVVRCRYMVGGGACCSLGDLYTGLLASLVNASDYARPVLLQATGTPASWPQTYCIMACKHTLLLHMACACSRSCPIIRSSPELRFGKHPSSLSSRLT